MISNLAVGGTTSTSRPPGARALPVGYTPGVLTETTADLAFALLLAAARRLPEGARAVREGEWRTWEPDWLLDVHGATLAIVGMGRIGQAVARRAAGFGMKVLEIGRGETEKLGEADFVSLHVPLNMRTATSWTNASSPR